MAPVSVPSDALVGIFKFLNVRGLLRSRGVCVYWRDAGSQGALWSPLYKSRFPNAVVGAVVPSSLWGPCYWHRCRVLGEVEDRCRMDKMFKSGRWGLCDVVGCLFVGKKGKGMKVHEYEMHGIGKDGGGRKKEEEGGGERERRRRRRRGRRNSCCNVFYLKGKHFVRGVHYS